MNLKRILAMVVVACFTAPIVACDDVTKPPPPPPPPQITTNVHFTKAIDTDGKQIGLQSNDVYALHVTSAGPLWIGNQGGVAVYDNPASPTRSDAFDQNNGLSNPKARAFAELDGKIYVGTWGGGVGVYDVLGDSWRVLRVSDGLVNDLVSEIKVDDGKVYIATNGGVSCYNPATEGWSRFTKNPTPSVKGDLLDAFVSTFEIAETPRGKEFWYCPRWESNVDVGTEGEHGITISRGSFNAKPDTIRLQPVKDNTLYEEASGALSNGAGTRIFVGTSSGIQRRGVIKFDVSNAGIPNDAFITRVTLRMTVLTGGAVSGNSVLLYRASSEWGEGTSVAPGDESNGGPATVGDATWVHTFYPDNRWTTPGGDYAGTSSASISVDSPRQYSWSSAGMAADVTSWLANPSSNHGWVITGGSSLKYFASREDATVEFRPQLEVVYARYLYATMVDSDLPEPNVNDIYYDEADNLFWLALSTRGVAKVDVENAKWTIYNTDHGLPSNVVYSIAKVNGKLWFGTQNGLAQQLATGAFRGYNSGGGLPADRVRRVYSDDGQRLWLGFVGAGAARVDPNSAK